MPILLSSSPKKSSVLGKTRLKENDELYQGSSSICIQKAKDT